MNQQQQRATAVRSIPNATPQNRSSNTQSGRTNNPMNPYPGNPMLAEAIQQKNINPSGLPLFALPIRSVPIIPPSSRMGGPQSSAKLVTPPTQHPRVLQQEEYLSRAAYCKRLKTGESSMLQSTVVEKVKKSKFVEESSDEEDSEVDSDILIDSGDEDERDQVKPKAIPAVQQQPQKPIPQPKKPKVNRRILPKTVHEYEKLRHWKVDYVAQSPELLIPIKLEFDIGDHKFNETFSWNFHEKSITPESFAVYICRDLHLNNDYAAMIASRVRQQLEEYKVWFSAYDVPVEQDTRVTIKLDIMSGRVHLRDRFEWDLSTLSSPEEFARVMVGELHLGGEFVTLIANSIREQIHRIRKETPELDPSYPIEKPLRGDEEARSWGPVIECGVDPSRDVEPDEEDRATRLRRREARATMAKKRTPAMPDLRVLRRSGTSESIPGLGGRLTPSSSAADMGPQWRCSHCYCNSTQAGTLRSGPKGDNTLCNSCGLYYESQGSLPSHRLNLFRSK